VRAFRGAPVRHRAATRPIVDVASGLALLS
jgi:hypothetical protein